MNRRLTALLSCAGLLAVAAGANAGTTIDLGAEASRAAVNDLARASVFAEASGGAPGELAKRINAQIAEASRLLKTYPSIRSRGGSTQTHPSYGKGGRIEAWRMRSEIVLESTDIAAVSEVLGKLQATLAVGQLSLMPSDETRRRAEDDATLAAIAAFRGRAAKLGEALGKRWKIRHLAVNVPHRPPVTPMLRAAPMMAMAEAAPMPIDAGESQVSVNISGQIELDD